MLERVDPLLQLASEAACWPAYDAGVTSRGAIVARTDTFSEVAATWRFAAKPHLPGRLHAAGGGAQWGDTAHEDT